MLEDLLTVCQFTLGTNELEAGADRYMSHSYTHLVVEIDDNRCIDCAICDGKYLRL
jgi:NAD-dependent dihydropyrimidine dehydrogenase PreA subunit